MCVQGLTNWWACAGACIHRAVQSVGVAHVGECARAGWYRFVHASRECKEGLHTCLCNRMSSSRYLPMHVQRNGVAYACESKRGCAKGSGWCTWVSVHGGRQKVAYMYVCTVLCKWMGLHKCVHARVCVQGGTCMCACSGVCKEVGLHTCTRS